MSQLFCRMGLNLSHSQWNFALLGRIPKKRCVCLTTLSGGGWCLYSTVCLLYATDHEPRALLTRQHSTTELLPQPVYVVLLVLTWTTAKLVSARPLHCKQDSTFVNSKYLRSYSEVIQIFCPLLSTSIHLDPVCNCCCGVLSVTSYFPHFFSTFIN